MSDLKSVIKANNILDMYDAVNLTDEDLIKVIIEKRPSHTGYVVEIRIKSHGVTPKSITNTVHGASSIIGHLNNQLDNEYTTLILTQHGQESNDAFLTRINQAIESTTAGIIAHSQNRNQKARHTLALAA